MTFCGAPGYQREWWAGVCGRVRHRAAVVSVARGSPDWRSQRHCRGVRGALRGRGRPHPRAGIPPRRARPDPRGAGRLANRRRRAGEIRARRVLRRGVGGAGRPGHRRCRGARPGPLHPARPGRRRTVPARPPGHLLPAPAGGGPPPPRSTALVLVLSDTRRRSGLDAGQLASQGSAAAAGVSGSCRGRRRDRRAGRAAAARVCRRGAPSERTRSPRSRRAGDSCCRPATARSPSPRAPPT